MIKGDFGKFIKDIRLTKYPVASQLAAKLNISLAYYLDIEKGNRLPSKSLLFKIINELNIEKNNTEIFDLLSQETIKENIPIDVLQYMMDNPYIINILRRCKLKNTKKEQWEIIEKNIGEV